MRGFIVVIVCLLAHPLSTSAEVTSVTIISRTLLAGGQSFGATGSYERLVGRIEFALDPADPHNVGIVDLNHARRDADGRVRFSSDLNVLRPTDPTKGNGVLLFGISNRGVTDLMGGFNRGNASDGGIGDGLLMRDGYTMVFVGWEFDVPAPRLRIEPPAALLPAGSSAEPLSVEIMVNERAGEAFLIDDPAGRPPVPYPPAELSNPKDVLIVRDHFLETGTIIPRARWRFVLGPNGLPKIQLEGGFDPGRFYRVTYYATAPVVAGVGLAAIRDAASAFRYRSDLPIHGRAVYAFGQSQAGRFLRQFLYDGFNVDERDRRVFDAIWVHKAGAARGSFNERFATPSPGDLFRPTRFPFSDADQVDIDGTRAGLSSRYRADQRPKIFYVNTSVEYWGGGRAAALTHTTVDGKRDLVLPDNIRIYFLASTQHIVPPFPPVRTPPVVGSKCRGGAAKWRAAVEQSDTSRQRHARAPPSVAPVGGRRHITTGQPVPAIQRQDFGVDSEECVPCRFRGCQIHGRSKDRARTIGAKVTPLPHLVPQVDRDGNDLGGIRDPEVAVPLATTTGWNFRGYPLGIPLKSISCWGPIFPFAPTRAARKSIGDSRLSIEERYQRSDEYLQRVRSPRRWT